MPTSPSLLLLSIAYALSIASTSCAFQPGPLVGKFGKVGQKIINTAASDKLSIAFEDYNSRRRIVMLDSIKSDNGQQIITLEEEEEEEAELYNEDGTEFEIDLENIEDGINEYYSSAASNDGSNNKEMMKDDDDDDDDGTSKKKKRLIECSASILLPFSEDVAFDAFSDLTRQPSWCEYLHSVEYIGIADDNECAVNNDDSNKHCTPLRKSKWTVGVKGLRFSWTAKDTNMSRPKLIEWESTSGMKNIGSVEFLPAAITAASSSSSSSSSSPNEKSVEETTTAAAAATQMTIYFTFVGPRVLSSLFRRSNKIRKYTEDVLLMNMLMNFRDTVVMEEDDNL